MSMENETAGIGKNSTDQQKKFRLLMRKAEKLDGLRV